MIAGAPLSVKATYKEDLEAADKQSQVIKQSPPDLQCVRQCIKELQFCLMFDRDECYLDYFKCQIECAGEDSETDNIENFLDNSQEYLEEFLDNQVELQQLQDIGESICKLRCEVEYEECRDNHGLEGIRTCLIEREVCREACESESDHDDGEDDNNDTYGVIIRNLNAN